MARIEGGVEHVGGMCALAERKLDGVFFVGLATAMVALVQFKPMGTASRQVVNRE